MVSPACDIEIMQLEEYGETVRGVDTVVEMKNSHFIVSLDESRSSGKVDRQRVADGTTLFQKAGDKKIAAEIVCRSSQKKAKRPQLV